MQVAAYAAAISSAASYMRPQAAVYGAAGVSVYGLQAAVYIYGAAVVYGAAGRCRRVYMGMQVGVYRAAGGCIRCCRLLYIGLHKVLQAIVYGVAGGWLYMGLHAGA